MEYKDYYKILGVPRTATEADVKKAFRKLARQHHPDLKPGDKKAEQAFKDANEANEVLSDPAKRRQYDELGANWEQYARAGAAGRTGGGNPYAGFNFGQGGSARYEFRGGDAGQFSDFFRTFFGGAAAGFGDAQAPEPGAGRGRETTGRTLEDLLAGMGGAGAPAARGHGRLAPAEAEAEISLEEAFSGTTRLVDVDGKRLEIKLPAGVDTGSRIKLTGKGGEAGPGMGARDLVIVPKVRPHATFTRSGADLTRELRVTLREALLGGEVPVPTLTGRVLLTLPAGTQSGRTFRLTGQGMPRLKGDGRGDLYVKIVVVLPARLTDDAKAVAATFLDLVDQPDPRAG